MSTIKDYYDNRLLFFVTFFSFTSLLAAAIGWYANDVNTEINDTLDTIDKKFHG